ncbi:zinc finger protein PLAG1-like [Neocloeon triangulifer]|uniref:zinc finger protein PLAG1-like n=1 Tax=Neocloeon triangulifer TaxID=2078957 RepID=UPI00286F9A76|nr:zinc finger protein PLAG1-like [Neocloeon triangulifer]
MGTKAPTKQTAADVASDEPDGRRQLRPRACPNCQARFSSPQELESHKCPAVTPPAAPESPRRRKTRSMRTEGTPAKAHQCGRCEKAFSSPGKLFQHMYSHTGERPFACNECSKAFSSKFKLMRHLLIHTTERKHQCQFCERSFHRKDHLKNHSKVHNPDKKVYRCDKEGCRKEYNSVLSYRKHMAVHAAEEGGLECAMCGRSFATREEILYHLKVHAGSRTVKSPSEKKFQCEHCERRFFTRKDVKRHLVVHTGKRDFLCQFCPQRFGRKDHLVRHIKKSHAGRKPKRETEPSTQPPEPPDWNQPGPSGMQSRRRPRKEEETPQPDQPQPQPSQPQQQPSSQQQQQYAYYPELGIKMEEDDGVEDLFRLAEPNQGLEDPLTLIESLSVDESSRLVLMENQPRPLPGFSQVFQPQEPPPPNPPQ